MKKHFMVFITLIAAMMVIFLNGCATTTTTSATPTQEVAVAAPSVDGSIGTWNYVIAGTPAGDIGGDFIVGKEGGAYTGSFEGSMLSGPLEDVSVVDGNFTGTMYYSGMPLQISGAFEGNSFSGALSTSMGDFPMTAQKRQ